MDKYIVGIIDDEQNAISKIRGIIKENKPEDVEVDFKTYFLENEKGISIKKLSKEILEDIKKNKINTLIIDQKIIVNAGEVEGIEIFKSIKDTVDKFPVIMLTNVAGECIKDDFVDPDKVYKKSDFFAIDEEKSKELVRKIFINAKKYNDNRTQIEAKIRVLQNEISENGNNAEIVSEIIDNEEKLSELKPTDYTQIEKIVNPQKIKDVLDLLNEVNNLLE
mgnify:FL=1